MKLTDMRCRSAKPSNKPYKLFDGHGLYLLVTPSGSRLWRMKYSYRGRENVFSAGRYPVTSLQEAREACFKVQKQLASGIDPNAEKQKVKAEQELEEKHTFLKVAQDWHAKRIEGWSAKHAQTVWRKLDRDVLPVIGGKPISQIDAPTLLKALEAIEARGSYDIAGRTRQICAQVFSHGIRIGACQSNPAESLRGALKTVKTEHFAAIKADDLSELLEAIERNDARLFQRTRLALMLSLYTFLRPGEVRQLEWNDVDWEKRQIVIPASRMKMRREHIVPLSSQALSILEQAKHELQGLDTPYIFPSQTRRNKPMSDGTVLVALKRLGFSGRMTAHGFRALARTAIREELNYAPDVIEAQLAHKALGALGEAYNRAQFLQERKVMMQDWADFIETKKGK